jgi:AcrR family transcriptional regulator
VPKIVDHDARREEIARALWRVVRRDGIGAASVRSVAAEAGWSAGAVRYYFPDQAGLLGFAIELVTRRVGERIARLQPTGPPLTFALRYLEEVIPLDDERRAEFDVWFAFLAQSQAASEADGTLRPHVEPVHADLLGLCRSVLEALREAGALRPRLNLSLEAERLHALVDGLSLHVATNPDRVPPARVREILRRHLATLAKA